MNGFQGGIASDGGIMGIDQSAQDCWQNSSRTFAGDDISKARHLSFYCPTSISDNLFAVVGQICHSIWNNLKQVLHFFNLVMFDCNEQKPSCCEDSTREPCMTIFSLCLQSGSSCVFEYCLYILRNKWRGQNWPWSITVVSSYIPTRSSIQNKVWLFYPAFNQALL